jgi:hypothetical protein
MDAIPRSATSDEVSKPNPNMTPRGYIFQGLGGEHSTLLALVRSLRDSPIDKLEHPAKAAEQQSTARDVEWRFVLGALFNEFLQL